MFSNASSDANRGTGDCSPQQEAEMAVYSGVHNRYPPLPEKQCRDQPHAGTRIMQQAQSGGQVGLVTGRKKGPRWLSWLWGHKRREGKGKTGHGPSPKVREHLQTVLDHTLPHQRLFLDAQSTALSPGRWRMRREPRNRTWRCICNREAPCRLRYWVTSVPGAAGRRGLRAAARQQLWATGRMSGSGWL